jgi:hypothetical protein
MSESSPYDPGEPPTKPPPLPGESVLIEVGGLPPYKDEDFSIRNPRHKIHERFANLRKRATEAMAGRAPYRGPVQLDVTIRTESLEQGKSVSDYAAGVQDTLGGSHGAEFTYLPIAYEDDCQVCVCRCELEISAHQTYEVALTFLAHDSSASPA